MSWLMQVQLDYKNEAKDSLSLGKWYGSVSQSVAFLHS